MSYRVMEKRKIQRIEMNIWIIISRKIVKGMTEIFEEQEMIETCEGQEMIEICEG